MLLFPMLNLKYLDLLLVVGCVKYNVYKCFKQFKNMLTNKPRRNL